MVKRGEQLEVWTMRPFPAGTLLFIPDSTELKDRYFTWTRSALVKCAGKADGKRTVIDGRLRHAPSDNRSCSLFFAIERSETADECNLEQQYSTVTLKAEIEFPGVSGKRKHNAMAWSADDLPQMPYITNVNAVKKGVRLVCKVDFEIKKLYDAEQKKTAAAHAKAKTAKKEGAAK